MAAPAAERPLDQVITTPLAAPLFVVYATEDRWWRPYWLTRNLALLLRGGGAPIEVVREIG
jgi:hypothetical protein